MKHEYVHTCFSRIASEVPTNIAIAAGPRQLTYRELEERSNSLANFLLANGASAGAPVAVLTDDRVEILIAILGILKARCAFAPLDPSISDTRLEEMISLLAPEWFITETQLLARVNELLQKTGKTARVVCVSDYASYPNLAHPDVESQPDDLCYVYFTSGSTAQPKAIAGRLKSIDHFIRWEIKTLGLGADVRVSQILPPTFDGSLRDIFIPLCTGGTACVPDDNHTVLDTKKLIAWLNRERISVIHCVPSLFRSLLNEQLTAGNFTSLKHILMAGEPLLPADVKRWTHIFGERIQLVNLYGTSETTMAKFAYFVKAADQERRAIPVGKPIEGAAAMVVDKRGRPCPRGTIGEIYIRTPYRALGYYNQPELTSQAFIQNPFNNDPNDIVHKTGDLGRVLEDGNFEYLGRANGQTATGPSEEAVTALTSKKLGSRAPAVEPVKRASRQLPLSFAQRRLWFIDQLEPGSWAYNSPLAVRLNGRLDIDALQRTLSEIVRRHEALRTTFAVADEAPIQVISAPAEVPLPLLDLSGLPEDERDSEARMLADREYKRPFDLSRGPLLRALLIRLSEQKHIAVLTLHHIVTDGWSLGVLIREVAALYDAYARGEHSPLAELPIQYADYAVWQREWLQGEMLDEQMDYWREQLAGAPTLELPTDRPRSARQSYRGAQLAFGFSKELAEKLREFSQREGVTLFMTLLSAWQTLLARYSGQWDLSVGTPIANRTRSEVEGLIGFFVNTLVLRTRLSPEASFRKQLQQTREVCLGAYAHQDVPFEMLVEELQPERHLSRSPLFQVMFGLENVPLRELELEGLKLEPLEGDINTTRFDLTVNLSEVSGTLKGGCEYSTDLFDELTITRMMAQWQVLLDAAVADAGQSLSALPLLTEPERRQLLEWNETAVEYPREQTIHALFAQQAVNRATAVAVEYEGAGLSYGELNRRANQLAHYLRRLGVGPEVRVGLCVERSLELVVALLGILKAGGAYVPLDREYPLERLRFMIEDAQLRWVLTNDGALAELAHETGVQVIDLAATAEQIGVESEAELESGAAADNLAYVIYTSGSTGTPKGVEVTHRSVLRLVLNTDYVQLRPEDRVAQAATVSFDASTFEVWGALLNGATVVVLDKEVTLEPQRFAAALKARRISALFLTTALFNQLVQADAGVFAQARAVLFGGEAVDPRWVRAVLQHGAPERLLHVYGPTEVTTFSTWQLVTEVAADATTVPIGRPIANTEAYVLDEWLRLTPVGVNGELYLAGDGLARDYLNRAELTAERFVPHPYARRAGERLYRTGDVVRYLTNGEIEFVGRRDAQVKVRGFRIELGEIETVLSQHTEVREAVAVVREPQAGNKQLVAYVVGEAAVTELRRYLKEKLPDYMVPQALVKLEALPLNANGKVDRQALPAPDRAAEEAEAGYVAPRTPEEELLAGVWAEVLEVDRVSVYDNFFERGGHSLLATQVVSRVRALFRIELPLRALFDAATLAELAQVIVAERKSGAASTAPPIERRSEDTEPALSYAQQRLWFLDQFEPDSPFYNVPAAMRLKGHLDRAALVQSLSEIARRHEVLRTSFPSIAGRPVQHIAPAAEAHTSATHTRPAVTPTASINLPVIDLQALPKETKDAVAQRLIAEEAARSFDLSYGPVWRVTLLRLDALEHVLLLTMHHIVTDGWSVGVLIRELTALYEAYSRAETSPLAELPIQYADFAVWQREWLQGEVLEEQLGYWREQLATSSGVLELPTDHARPPVQTYRGASRPVQLSEELTDKLRDLSRREGVTLFMTLLSGWQTLLARYSGQWDLNIGTPIANRTRGEVEGLIGFFVNTLVLRTRMKPQASFREQLQQVREVCLRAYAHQDVPFEMLVEELQPERDLSRSPLFQVMFALQNAPVGELELPGLKLEPLEGESHTSKFDLMLTMLETETGLVGWCEYSTDLFEETTITRMLEQWRVLLEAAVADPAQSLSALPLLSEAERQQLLAWNDTSSDYPREQTIHDLFTQQAMNRATSVAVEYEGARLSYEELNRRANQLARYLRESGVGPEVRVGLCVERSLEMVVGLLAILKAGGAYVPLDREYPRERLRFMIEDAQLWLVLATGQALAGLTEETGVFIVDLSAEAEQISLESEAEINSGVSADSLAYVIYTSGSTGTPKGVEVTHRAVLRLVLNTNYVTLSDETSVLQLAPLSFDASTFEVWAPLLHGGRLSLMKPGLATAAEIGTAIRERRVETMWLTASLFNAVVDEGCGELRGLKQLLVGGEALSVKHIAQAQQVLNGTRLINGYGPTESTTFACCHEIGTVSNGASIPIGRPIANSEAYVLDDWLGLTPVGVNGELYLGGDGLARDYLNRAEFTAKRFVPHPYARRPGERLYRTGDVVRYLPNGEIEFVGRRDAQVKVRGFRIELGEIETILSQHPEVREVVAVVREPQAGNKQLVAYVVGEATGNELRRYLKEKLPEYMVPQLFVSLESLPLNANGKIDRQALPAPERAGEVAQGCVAPRTPEEELLASIWSEVLEVDRLSVHDNFFDLGGHSLLATQVTSRIQTAFNLELPVRTIFERPTIAELAQEIATMVAAVAGPGSVPARMRVARDVPLPLSFAQRRLWFLHQLDPQSAVYNMHTALHVRGPLNIPAFKQTINEIIRRHEVLRTTFVTRDGEPFQVIAPAKQQEFPLIDLRRLQSEDRLVQATQLAAIELSRPFDLAQTAPFRMILMMLSEDEHVVAFTMHHIVSDGWSMGLLMKEMTTLYESFSQNAPSPLAELSLQYADFASWQIGWLQGEVLDTQLAYWEQKLGGAPAVLELPADRPRPTTQTFRGSGASFAWSTSLSDSLNELSKAEGATLFMTLLAAFNVLLHRYTNQTDILVGTDVANRNRREIEPLFGFFINQLVVRTDLSGDPTFRELLARVRETSLEAYAHQDLPFERLVEALQPERHLSRSPLFQTKLLLQNFPTSELHLREVTLSPLEIERTSSPFDLTLAITEGDYLSGWLQYSTELFDESTIERMLKHYETLLESIAANPEQRVSEFPLVTEAELAQLLAQSTGARESYPHDTCVHQLFEAQVERTPNATAVVFEDQELTYAELNARANQLAHHLRNLGVREEMLVGLCVERSVEMIVAVLGILKAGAAFLPLDPSYPLERLAFMLEDAQVAVLLTEEELVDSLPNHWAQVICLDSDAELIAGQSSDNPTTAVTAENLAYVIYTSGSTGKPKGVMIQHGGICNLVTVQIKAFDMRPECRVLQFASLSFDASVWEIFMTLPSGARLVLGRREEMVPGSGLETLLRRHEITTATLPPTVLRALDERQEKLAVVIAAGESLDKKTAERWRKRKTGGRLIDAYGPTELTVCASMAEVETELPTIGKPIANSEVYILDERMRPVPLGVTGELYLGGVGIARGYLNRPELTAEKFAPNPFGREGTRLYRTGDLGRWLANGEIDFLGRIDHQVKVRGYRIETGEIETLLNSHPDVMTSLVIAREDVPGEKQLIAYYVPEHGEQLSTLRSYLHESLPDYMVPSLFVMLDAMPLTPNGKVDRGALPAPDQVQQDSARKFVAPRNATEELLAGIWSQVLRVEEVGVHDNYFELGGDSILSIQIITRANRVGLQLTTKQIFQYQTVAQLAAHAGTSEAEEAILAAGLREPFAMVSAEDRARMPAGVEDAYPLAMMQAGMIFHSEFTPDAPLYHSISTFNVRAPFDADALAQAVADLATIHEVMRTSFDLANFGEPLQLVHRRVEVPVGITDLRDLSDEEQEHELARWLDEENRSFSWGEVPMVRFHLHRRTDDTFQFTFTAHHAIFDGWSDGLFLTELFRRYVTLMKDRQSDTSTTAELGPLASRYRDFIALERAALASPDARAFWQNVLSESKPTRLPRARQDGASGVVNTAAIKLNEQVSGGLRALARRAGVPLKSVLLAAHLRVLNAISGERDIVTGLVSNGRPETTDGDRIVGLFLNTLPFRASLDGGTWEELAAQVFRAERELLPYRRYPLSQIQRENGGQTLFDTCFNYVHFHVLEQLAGFRELEILGTGGTADTNFALLVSFNLMTQTPEIEVSVSCDDAKISVPAPVIAGYYQRLLESMAETAEGEHYELCSILSEAEQHKLLVELNQTARSYPEINGMHRLFEMQVEQTPGAVALVCGDERLTYRELNERATQLAHHLVALGVRGEQRVGILLERSTAMVVSILAVLKAGGCYVPLDPGYPSERLSFMTMDADLAAVLTTRALAESLKLEASDGYMRLVYVDEQPATVESTAMAETAGNLSVEVSGQQLAYLIYTSGSTGVPKGVAIAHESATRFIQWASEVFDAQALGGVLFSTSICFDLSIFELFVTLSNGGKVILAENALELPVLPAAGEVTLINTVPSAMAELVRSGAVPKSVRVANLAGEPLSKDLVAEIYAKTAVETVYNLYGPSEDTTYSTFTAVKAGERVAIGRPVANTRVYLLDESGQTVPLGVVGELYLGGAGLARGYWERPELTAERFIPDNFSGEVGARLYRTGDLARYSENGEIEFLGRVDHQVKVRGYRIELGEIESVLRSLSGVKDAVVVANLDASGSQQLVAYVVRAAALGSATAVNSAAVVNSTAAVSSAAVVNSTAVVNSAAVVNSVELREQLRQRLPDYMVPSAFVTLAELPLTPNGKIDRKALPAIDDSRPETVDSYVAPRDMVELRLTRLWEELLPVRPIGVRDNFFTLGGHSLVAVRLALRIEQELGKKLPIRAVFQGATIEHLAALLRHGTAKVPRLAQLGGGVPELRSGRKLPLICVHPAGGSISNYLNLAQHLDPDQPLYALQASGMDEDELPHETIEAMAADYLSAIHEAGIEGPYLLSGWSMGGVVAYEMARQLRAEGKEVAGLSLIDSIVPSPNIVKNIDELALLVGFAQTIGLRVENVSPDEISDLSTADKLALLLTRAQQEHLLPLEVQLPDIQRYFNVYRANILAFSNYIPQPQPVRITLFKAEERITQNGKDAALGWDALTEEQVDVHVVPGNHYTLLTEPNVKVLAEHLQAWLNKAEGVFV